MYEGGEGGKGVMWSWMALGVCVFRRDGGYEGSYWWWWEEELLLELATMLPSDDSIVALKLTIPLEVLDLCRGDV